MIMFYVAEDNRLHFSEFPILNTMILGVYSWKYFNGNTYLI